VSFLCFDAFWQDEVDNFFSLCHNNIGAEGGKALGEALEKNDSLSELYLRKNGLEKESGTAIAGALEKNNSLQVLK